MNKDIGYWTVVNTITEKPALYMCQCVCGSTKEIFSHQFFKSKHCGCKVVEVGNTYNNWTVKHYAGRKGPYNRPKYHCVCSCGMELEVDGATLRSGGSKGCAQCHNKRAREMGFRTYLEKKRAKWDLD